MKISKTLQLASHNTHTRVLRIRNSIFTHYTDMINCETFRRKCMHQTRQDPHIHTLIDVKISNDLKSIKLYINAEKEAQRNDRIHEYQQIVYKNLVNRLNLRKAPRFYCCYVNVLSGNKLSNEVPQLNPS